MNPLRKTIFLTTLINTLYLAGYTPTIEGKEPPCYQKAPSTLEQQIQIGSPSEIGKQQIEDTTNKPTNDLETKLEPSSKLPLAQEYGFDKRDLKQYQTKIKQTIDYSKKTGKTVIIINKADYELQVYTAGKLQKKFPIELGKNPYNDKRMQGDNTTPEGVYNINQVKDINETNFYRAAQINYPNQQDIMEFNRLKRAHIIPKTATIGGEINIHGHGSGLAANNGGMNWTQGCIALSNEQMDELFPYLQKDTKILIVKYDKPTVTIPEPDKDEAVKIFKQLSRTIPKF